MNEEENINENEGIWKNWGPGDWGANALQKVEVNKIYKWLDLLEKEITQLRDELVDEAILEKVKEKIVKSSQKDIVTECITAIKDVAALQIQYRDALTQLQRQQLEFEEKQKQWNVHYEKQKKEIDELRASLGYESKFNDKSF